MSTKFNKEDLINYRIEQANKTIHEIPLLVDNELNKTAVNRIYYGMFYMLLALALKYDYKTSKHRQLIGWFNKTFIKTGAIDLKYGKIINDAYENRSDSDYGLFIEFSKEEVEEMFNEMKMFIAEIKRYLNKE
jgi:uncharacterized protein (UPF0332 family)